VIALALLAAAQFMIILDVTVVNLALPSIQRDIGIASGDLQWVLTAYTLAFGGLLLLGGRAADLFGRRRMFLTGLAVFTAASLGSALAGSTAGLLTTRALQGVGAAMLSPAALSMISTIFPAGPERNRALAIWGGVAAAGGAVGVLVGGGLTDVFGWKSIFLVNLPVGAIVAAAAWRVLPAAPGTGGHLDLAGALLATGSLVSLIYGLVDADSAGWGSAQTIGLLALAATGLGAFIAVESRTAAPLVDLPIFQRRTTVTALALMIGGIGSLFSGYFFSSLYLQQVLGHSALQTGLEFLPVAVAIGLAAHAGGHLVSQLGAKPVIVAGMTIGAAGALLLSGLSAGGSYAADILPGLLVVGLGAGLSISGVMITAMSGAGHEDAGVISGLTSTAHEIGISLVLAVLSTIAASQIGGGGIDQAAGADPVQLTAGFGDAFRAAAAIGAGGALLALTALRRDDVAPGTAPAFAGH
jgi:EmrB/QacA subfamily drug resistance transporter